jgi:hypothetical protein
MWVVENVRGDQWAFWDDDCDAALTRVWPAEEDALFSIAAFSHLLVPREPALTAVPILTGVLEHRILRIPELRGYAVFDGLLRELSRSYLK